MTGESVDRQHRIIVCRMNLGVRKRKRAKVEQVIKWCKLKKEDCCEDLRESLRQALGGPE